MNTSIFNHFTLSLIIFISISICIFIYLLVAIKRKTSSKKKVIAVVAVLMIININISFTIPYYKFLNYESVEEAFDFRYPKGKIVFQRKLKNTAFVYGTESFKSEDEYSYPGNFSLYIKKGTAWKIKYIGEDNLKNYICIYAKNSGKRYDIYKFSNKEENVTGIYITNFLADSPLSSNTKIKDSYNTEFERVEVLDSEMYDTYMFFGVVTKEIEKNYYISIDGEKYKLSDYGPLCPF